VLVLDDAADVVLPDVAVTVTVLVTGAGVVVTVFVAVFVTVGAAGSGQDSTFEVIVHATFVVGAAATAAVPISSNPPAMRATTLTRERITPRPWKHRRCPTANRRRRPGASAWYRKPW
jgi:hypothetical protein